MRKLIWILAIGFLTYFVIVFRLFWNEGTSADAEFLVKWGVLFGTLAAVMTALYGDSIREKIDPIRLRITVPVETNSVVDRRLVDGVPCAAYCHHLRVVNQTPHRPVKQCRVWMRRISVRGLNGDWQEQIKFAVPRLMEWAPAEYSPDKRTFSTDQVFDLGVTFGDDKGFELTIFRQQGGNFHRRFATGQSIRIELFATADNYLGCESFVFQVDIPKHDFNHEVTPAVVTPM